MAAESDDNRRGPDRQLDRLTSHIDELFEKDRLTQSTLVRLSTALEANTDVVKALVDDVKSSNRKDWTSILVVVLMVLGMAGSFFYSQLIPFNDRLDKIDSNMGSRTKLVYEAPVLIAKNAENIQRVEQYAREHDISIAKLEVYKDWNTTWLKYIEEQGGDRDDHLREQNARLAMLEGIQNRIAKQLDAVDNEGSRVHNGLKIAQ